MAGPSGSTNGLPGTNGTNGVPGTDGTPGTPGTAAGGGIFNDTSGTVQLKNTIVANNTAGGNFAGAGTYVSLGHNLSNDYTGASPLPGGTDLTADPQLGALANNGGPTQTMAITSSSPAFNAGDNSGAPATDQRGYNRIVGGTIDIGAFEVQTLQDKSGQIGVSKNGVGHKPGTDVYSQTLTLTNTGGTLTGAFLVVLNGLPSNDILTGASFRDAQGNLTPLTVTMSQPGGSSGGEIFVPASLAALLNKGQSLKLVLTFQLDDPALFTFTTKTYQDNS